MATSRKDIVESYKTYFGLQDSGLAEGDELMIEWAEALIEEHAVVRDSDAHEYFVLYVDEKCAGTFDTESEAKDASVAYSGTIDIVKRNIKWD